MDESSIITQVQRDECQQQLNSNGNHAPTLNEKGGIFMLFIIHNKDYSNTKYIVYTMPYYPLPHKTTFQHRIPAS